MSTIHTEETLMAKINLVGQQFGYWLVLSKDNDAKKYKKYSRWICKCRCGTIRSIDTKELKNKRKNGSCKRCVEYDGLKMDKNGSWTGYKNISGTYYGWIISNAKKRNLEVTVTIEYIGELIELQKYKCALSGIEIKFKDVIDKTQTASLDRIDSSKGYTPGNVQWVHKDINKIKGRLSDEKLIMWCKLIKDYK